MISAASAASAGLGVLVGVVADSVLARDEDHRGRHPVGDAHRVVRRARVHAHVRLAGRLRGVLECRDDPLVHRRCGQGLPLVVLGTHSAAAGGLLGVGGDLAGHAAIRVVDGPADVEREAHLGGDGVDDARVDLDLADRAHRALACVPREPLELDDRLGEREGRVEPEVHRRRPGVVPAAVDDHVGVDVAGDRGDEADPVAGVLEHARLLDVHLDPAGEVVEHVRALAPTLGRVPRLGRVVPEAATVVDRAEPLAEILLVDPLRDDPAAEQHLAEAGTLLLQERDQLQRQVEAELSAQPADLQGGDDAHRPVVAAAVPVRVAVRADPEHRLALRPVAGVERPDRVLLDREADRLELAGEPVERVAVLLGVGVAPDRLGAERVVGAGEGLDVALDPFRAPCPVHRGDSRAWTNAEWPRPVGDARPARRSGSSARRPPSRPRRRAW